MRLASFHFLLEFLGAALSCDPRERETIVKDINDFAYFVFAVEETSEGSFNTSLLLQMMGFEDTSRQPPLLLNGLMNGALVTQCGKGGLDIEITFWMSSRTIPLSGTLYGCEMVHKKLRKLIVYSNSTWNESDLVNFCNKRPGMPSKYLQDVTNCMKNANFFIHECLQTSITKNLTNVVAVLALGIAVGVLVAFIKVLIGFRRVSTRVIAIEN